MAVVINEFEVVPAEPQPTLQAGETESPAGKTSPLPSSDELRQLTERARERALRVWAH